MADRRPILRRVVHTVETTSPGDERWPRCSWTVELDIPPGTVGAQQLLDALHAIVDQQTRPAPLGQLT